MFDKAHTHDIFFFLVVRFKSSTTSMTKLGQPASGDLDETNPRSPNIIYFLSYEMTLATPVSKGWNPSNFFFCRQNLIKKIFKRFDTNFSNFFFFKCSEKYPFNWGFFFPMESIKWIKPVNYVRPTTFHLYTLEYGHMSRIGQMFISQRVR